VQGVSLTKAWARPWTVLQQRLRGSRVRWPATEQGHRRGVATC